jgi:hypothetical protein
MCIIQVLSFVSECFVGHCPLPVLGWWQGSWCVFGQEFTCLLGFLIEECLSISLRSSCVHSSVDFVKGLSLGADAKLDFDTGAAEAQAGGDQPAGIEAIEADCRRTEKWLQSSIEIHMQRLSTSTGQCLMQSAGYLIFEEPRLTAEASWLSRMKSDASVG